MSRTQLSGLQVLDGSVGRQDLDTSTTGSALIAKLLAGNGMSITSTGADSGTGDVTLGLVSGAQTIYIQDIAPPDVGKYIWFQTNYLVAGGLTIWLGIN